MMLLDTFLYTIVIFVDITGNPEENTTVTVGINVTLSCNATGADNLRYQWIRMGKKTIPSRAIGVNSSTLIIPNIMVKDSGRYYCAVSSGNTSVTSRPGTVFVFSKLLQSCIFTQAQSTITRIIICLTSCM